MERTIAEQFIRSGQKLMFVRHLDGPGFLCRFRYDPALSEKCSVVPSWRSWYLPDPTGEKPKGFFQGYRVHYLDLKTLEGVAYTCGYTLEFENEQTLHKLKDEYLMRRDWKNSQVIDIPLKRALDPKQTTGAQFLYRSRWALNADGMGAGKSAQGIGACELNRMDGRSSRTLVLSPKSVKGAWAKEFGICTDRKTTILSGKMETRFEQLEQLENAGETDVAIASFDSFVSDFKEIAKSFRPDILIVDEVHRICERGNKLTQILIGGKEVKKTFFDYADPHSGYLMTGTPISNDLEDLYSLLRLIDPELIHWLGFRNRYCLTEEGSRWQHPTAAAVAQALADGGKRPKARKTSFKTVVGYQNEKELKGKLSLFMIRRTKDEMLPDLPKKTFHTVDIELDAEERAVYDALSDEFTTTIRGKELTVKTQLEWMTRAQQICDSLEIVPNSTAKKSSKLVKMMELVQKNKDDRKIVIFSKYKQMTDIIVRELKSVGIKLCYLHGDVADEDRQPMVDEFQSDPEIRVFVSTLMAGGVGITLTAASLCILYDRWWSPGANFQAVDRLHRRGQLNPVDAVFLRVKDSVEEHVDSTWVEKQALVTDMIRDEAVLAKLTVDERARLI